MHDARVKTNGRRTLKQERSLSISQTCFSVCNMLL